MKSHTFSSPQVVCRPALPSDTADVLEFTKFIWDGHDYVPYVWNHWLKDPRGILAIAEYGEHAIGLAKVTWLAPGQWWFEGFRVDPKYQGMKVGSHIHGYIDEWWIKNGDGTVRLMTNAKNIRVHHLCEKLGFQKMGEAVGFNTVPLQGTSVPFTPAEDLKEMAAFALASESLRLSDGICDLGWRMLQLNESALQEFTSPSADFAHKPLWWRNKQALITIWEDDEDGEPALGIGLVACKMEDLPALLMDIRRLAAEKKCQRAFWIASVHAEIFAALERAGFERRWENSGFLFEKVHQ